MASVTEPQRHGALQDRECISLEMTIGVHRAIALGRRDPANVETPRVRLSDQQLVVGDPILGAHPVAAEPAAEAAAVKVHSVARLFPDRRAVDSDHLPMRSFKTPRTDRNGGAARTG